MHRFLQQQASQAKQVLAVGQKGQPKYKKRISWLYSNKEKHYHVQMMLQPNLHHPIPTVCK